MQKYQDETFQSFLVLLISLHLTGASNKLFNTELCFSRIGGFEHYFFPIRILGTSMLCYKDATDFNSFCKHPVHTADFKTTTIRN